MSQIAGLELISIARLLFNLYRFIIIINFVNQAIWIHFRYPIIISFIQNCINSILNLIEDFLIICYYYYFLNFLAFKKI